MNDIRIKELFILIVVLSLVISIKLIDRFGYKDEFSYAMEDMQIASSENSEDDKYKDKLDKDNSKDVNPYKPTPKIMVDVKGAVKFPNVYEIPKKSRVCDVVELAGGFTEEAQIEAVNLADYVYDAQKIVIPRIGEEVIESDIKTTKKWTISDLNRATPSQLESINGIGPSTAQKIVDYRNSHGEFHKLSDLTNISGIGARTVEKWKEFFIEP